jgi:hypothetical protein
MKYFYVVDHFVPFPSSEYGGLWNVIAKDNHECFDLITQADQDWNKKHYGELMSKIENSRRFVIDQDEQSCVVESFTT